MSGSNLSGGGGGGGRSERHSCNNSLERSEHRVWHEYCCLVVATGLVGRVLEPVYRSSGSRFGPNWSLRTRVGRNRSPGSRVCRNWSRGSCVGRNWSHGSRVGRGRSSRSHVGRPCLLERMLVGPISWVTCLERWSQSVSSVG